LPACKRPLWTCPKCGHRFVTRDMWHSCGRYRIAEHFKGKDRELLRLFRRFGTLVRRFGPVTVYAQKTRIVFQTRGRFVGVQVRRGWLNIGLWLKRRREHPRVYKIEYYPPSDYVHRLRVAEVRDLDSVLADFVREAYAVGRQQF
jgi:Domain of unknown function (DUF5655)